MPQATVLAQHFTAPWPGVLEDMIEYIALTQLSLGRHRPAQIHVTLSRQRVSAAQLQPHVSQFQARVHLQFPGAHLALRALNVAEHRVEIRFDG